MTTLYSVLFLKKDNAPEGHLAIVSIILSLVDAFGFIQGCSLG
jgi:hypothetical protein